MVGIRNLLAGFTYGSIALNIFILFYASDQWLCHYNESIPVTVASDERSFSKPKLIKTYIWASMKQKRLNGLAMLSIDKNVASELD